MHVRLTILMLVLLSALFARMTHSRAETNLTGLASRIVDGDTFDLRTRSGKVRIRLCGIDSPEKRMRGYHEARHSLKALLLDKPVLCIPVGNGTPCDGRSRTVSYNRIAAQCFVPQGDVAAALVRSGAACDWPRFSGGHYARIVGRSACIQHNR